MEVLRKIGNGLGGLAAVLLVIMLGVRSCALEAADPTVTLSLSDDTDTATRQMTDEIHRACDESLVAKILGISGPKGVVLVVTRFGMTDRLTVDCSSGNIINDEPG